MILHPLPPETVALVAQLARDLGCPPHQAIDRAVRLALLSRALVLGFGGAMGGGGARL